MLTVNKNKYNKKIITGENRHTAPHRGLSASWQISSERIVVWYLYPRRRVGISAKWQKFYTGPYQIVRVIEPNNVVLQKSRRGKPFVVHRDKIKAYYGDSPGSWKLQTVVPRVPDDVEEVDGTGQG